MRPVPGGWRAVRPVVAVAAVALAACSTTRTYPNDLAVKNLSIRTATSSGSVLSSVGAELEVHRVDAACRAEYVGTVGLGQAVVAVGVPIDRGSVLVFRFLSSGFLGSDRSQITRELYLEPQAGQRFEVDVSYRDSLYDVVVRERLPQGTLREVPRRDLRACRPVGSVRA